MFDGFNIKDLTKVKSIVVKKTYRIINSLSYEIMDFISLFLVVLWYIHIAGRTCRKSEASIVKMLQSPTYCEFIIIILI